MDNILTLHSELRNKTYKHGPYYHFKISDPKPRDIHKASVRDRLLHHAIHRVLYPYFDKKFIADSYSCRIEKGSHRAMSRFRAFAYRVSKNHTKTCWVLKCDIQKFFASINHQKLNQIVAKHLHCQDTLRLLSEIIQSFKASTHNLAVPRHSKVVGAEYQATSTPASIIDHRSPRGLPLGNLTSQLLVNIYMNEFDRHVKHKLKIKHYIRYADDFVFLSENRIRLESLIPRVSSFLEKEFHLKLHPKKLFIKTFASGVDFLGWVHFADHRVLRTATKRRMIRNLSESPSEETRASYRGLLKHGNSHKMKSLLFPVTDDDTLPGKFFDN